MNIRDIPVRVVGPGSQPTGSDGDTITYMDMPNDMSRFVAPIMPEPEDVLRMDGAREAMDWLRAALDDYAPGGQVSQGGVEGPVLAERCDHEHGAVALVVGRVGDLPHARRRRDEQRSSRRIGRGSPRLPATRRCRSARRGRRRRVHSHCLL